MINREHLEYAMRQEDDTVSNHTYRNEQELLELIKAGDVDQIRNLIQNSVFPDYPQLLAMNQQKNEEYMAVITIALAARAAIQAGISSTESFQISDVYLQKIARAHDLQTIHQLRDDALLTYGELVNRKKIDSRAGFYVEDCKRCIAANVFKKISVRDIAAMLHINPVYLERIFRASEGMTVGAYIRREKIGRARNLLIYSDRSVIEISNYLSFATLSYFGKVFKDETGMTPREFRKANRISGF